MITTFVIVEPGSEFELQDMVDDKGVLSGSSQDILPSIIAERHSDVLSFKTWVSWQVGDAIWKNLPAKLRVYPIDGLPNGIYYLEDLVREWEEALLDIND